MNLTLKIGGIEVMSGRMTMSPIIVYSKAVI